VPRRADKIGDLAGRFLVTPNDNLIDEVVEITAVSAPRPSLALKGFRPAAGFGPGL
jgi:hypothetical protein